MGIAGDAPDALGRVYIGDAVRVDDARPDVEAAFTTLPMNYRAGWGYLLLTNFLPNGGNGTFVLRAYAADREGHEALIGSRTIVAANSTVTRPFGAIDTPGQGETISGATYNNFGWVLARGPSMASPVFGGSVSVIIDGVAAGSPGAWTNRGDLDALFPAAIYPGITNALGVYTFDTRAYADGIHTISWGVTTNDQQVDGIGSRYFNIDNEVAGALTVAEAGARRDPGADIGRRGFEVAALDVATRVRSGTGYASRVPLTPVAPDSAGRRLVLGRQSQRVVVDASSAGSSSYEAYRVIGGRLAPLPPGASFDRSRGILYWQPVVGFAGDYDFEIITEQRRRVPVRVVLQPQRSPVRLAAAWRVNFAPAALAAQ
jgi:hypothetical protein